MNKYPRIPEKIIDLHRKTAQQAKEELDRLMKDESLNHVRIITGKGLHSKGGPVLRTFVMGYLRQRSIKFSTSKISEGGEGSLEAYFKE